MECGYALHRLRTVPPKLGLLKRLARISDETVWDFEFGIGNFRMKYRGIGIGFGIEIGTKSVSESVSTWCWY